MKKKKISKNTKPAKSNSDNSDDFKIGAYLKICRLMSKKKYKQFEAAKELNIDKTMLWAYENDFTKPKIKTLVAMADLYGCSVDELVGRKPINENKIDRDQLVRFILGKEEYNDNLSHENLPIVKNNYPNPQEFKIQGKAYRIEIVTKKDNQNNIIYEQVITTDDGKIVSSKPFNPTAYTVVKK